MRACTLRASRALCAPAPRFPHVTLHRRSARLPARAHLAPALSAAAQERVAFASLAAAAALSAQLEQRTRLGSHVSAPLLSMAFAAAAAGALPPDGVALAVARVWDGVLPAAVALALLQTDLRRLAESRDALAAFACATLGTLLGTVAAFCAVGRWLGADGWRLAACLCASYIGGTLNFSATASAVGLGADAGGRALIVAAMALDNVFMAAFLGVLLVLPTDDEKTTPALLADDSTRDSAHVMTVGSASAAFGTALACCAAAEWVAAACGCPAASLALVAVVASAASAAAAAGGLRPAQLFAGADAASGALLLLFFAALGACTNVGDALGMGGAAGAFIAVQLSVHLGVTLLLGRALRLPRRLLLLASNAAVGGPATAAAMAAARGWRDLTASAVLLGTLGYVCGTALGVAVGALLLCLAPLLLG